MKQEQLDILCQGYAKRIGNEIGWMSELIKNGNDVLNYLADSKYKNSVIGLNKQGVGASQKMQIVYLVNLFESFIQDFIRIKDGLTELEVNQNGFWNKYLRREKLLWNEDKKENYNSSTSFMNIRFSLFVLNKKYELKYPSYLSSTIPELGSLRNCLVHYDGDITRTDKGGHSFRETLVETLFFLETKQEEIKLIELNKNDFIDKIVFDFQTFIELCGGKINRPFEHMKENNTSNNQ
ncbi:hypothetical protein [Zobellia alginiliquefaciens]|uniref:hypothetical protein n=1 Tax=Zobellia alginiliquefaciens TaxID=3032586 RepID=UPI0023E411BF|nr:hypothetical protein [Zobellia alginiliquefaciens]